MLLYIIVGYYLYAFRSSGKIIREKYNMHTSIYIHMYVCIVTFYAHSVFAQTFRDPFAHTDCSRSPNDSSEIFPINPVCSIRTIFAIHLIYKKKPIFTYIVSLLLFFLNTNNEKYRYLHVYFSHTYGSNASIALRRCQDMVYNDIIHIYIYIKRT